MILQATHTVANANTEENLNNQGWRWLRILSAPAGAVVSIATAQKGEVAPFVTLNPLSDWAELKVPAEVCRIKSTVVGDVVYQFSMDDKIHSNLTVASGGGPSGFTPITITVAANSSNPLTPPSSAATLRFRVTGLAGGAMLRLHNANGFGIWVQDQTGNGYQTITRNGIYYADIAGYNPAEGALTLDEVNGGTANVTVMPASMERLKPMQSLLLNYKDLGVVPGTTSSTSGWQFLPFFFPGIRSVTFALEFAGIPNTANVALNITPVDLAGVADFGQNIQVTHFTGAATSPVAAPRLAWVTASTSGCTGSDDGQFGWGGPSIPLQPWGNSHGFALDTGGSAGTPAVFEDAWCVITF